MAALVAGALAQLGDRPAWLAALLADRFQRPLLVILAAALALALANAIAVLGARLVAPMLTPNAAQLLLALALGLQGLTSLWPARAPDRLADWRLGVAATSFLGLFILCFGDGLVFIAFALAAGAAVPALTAVGATLGGLAVIAPAALIGEAAWLRLPQRLARRAAAGLFLLAGTILALAALRLI